MPLGVKCSRMCQPKLSTLVCEAEGNQEPADTEKAFISSLSAKTLEGYRGNYFTSSIDSCI